MKKEAIFGLLLVVLVGGFLYFQVNKFNQNNKVNKIVSTVKITTTQNQESLKVSPTLSQKTFSMNEVKKHNSLSDCWLIINSKVYDVTNFIDNHPGGKAIANFCGQEATQAFNTKGKKGKPHKPEAYDVLKNLYIGDLE
ncbi:MAG: hypothetical protein Fur009_5480 [Candidatus Microgenomates bacterium]